MSPDLEANGEAATATNEEPLLGIRSLSENDHLDWYLCWLEKFFSLFGFQPWRSSLLNLIRSCSVFLVFGLAIGSVYLSRCLDGGCDVCEVRNFDLTVVVSQVLLALASVIFVSVSVRKFGFQRFILMDVDRTKMHSLRDQYVENLQHFFVMLGRTTLLPLLLKIDREIFRSLCARGEPLWLSIFAPVPSILVWTYLSAIFLSTCCLFGLACNLQIVRLEDFGRNLEKDDDVALFLEEHVSLRRCLSEISDRFHYYLLFIFVYFSVSQAAILFMITGYKDMITLVNAGGIAAALLAQGNGILTCSHSAVKVSHKAREAAALASEWHARTTCAADDSERDYLKRQSLVTYLQGNPGVISFFGWTVDWTLINHIFFIDLSLALFVLGKTIVWTSK